MPTKKDYFDAADIVDEVAKERIHIETLFKLFMPFSERKRYTNILRTYNYNWGADEIVLWHNALKQHRIKRPKYPIEKKAIKRNMECAHRLRKLGMIEGVLDRILETEYVKRLGFPSVMAAHFDYLFVSLEEDFSKRQYRLKQIFARRQKENDDKWVRIIYDYSREKSMMLRAEKMVEKYK